MTLFPLTLTISSTYISQISAAFIFLNSDADRRNFASSSLCTFKRSRENALLHNYCGGGVGGGGGDYGSGGGGGDGCGGDGCGGGGGGGGGGVRGMVVVVVVVAAVVVVVVHSSLPTARLYEKFDPTYVDFNDDKPGARHQYGRVEEEQDDVVLKETQTTFENQRAASHISHFDCPIV